MAKNELDTAFANVSAMLDLAQWLMLESAKRTSRDEDAPYEISRREGDQIMALLIVTDDYAKRVLVENRIADREADIVERLKKLHAEGGAS